LVAPLVSPKMADSGEHSLPRGWTKGFSRSQQKTYYVHAATKHTQWRFPTESEIRERAARAESSSSAKRAGGGGDHAMKRTKVSPDATSVAVIVPYRDLHPKQNRARHLREFVPHMTAFLERLRRQGKVTNYHVYIIEQSDDGRKFNRGKLLNIGFDLARKNRRFGHDVFIFHDVDLLPGDDLGDWYSKFPKIPLHIARVWGRYSNNPKYFGGIVSFSAEDMRKINGYPNTFWGWGGEDDEMQKRCEKVKMRWEYPPKGTIRDLEAMTLKEKLGFLRQNREWKCMVKWEALDEHDATWKTNGLSDLKYEVTGTTQLDGLDREKSKATKVTVDVLLNGNHWANDKCGVDFMGDH